VTIRQDYQDFLDNHFPGLKIRTPLFYNWDKALRFDLQVGETNIDEYFEEAQRRSNELFEAVFQPSDSIFIVLMDYKYKRGKLRPRNFVFRHIEDLNTSEISYSKACGLYEPNDKLDIRNIAVIKSKTERIDYRNILTAIGNTDFPQRQPRLDKSGVLTSKEIFFLNINKKAIFHMYDDRGTDIIASDIETLRPIYHRYKEWLLQYDIERMENALKQNGL
jgi:hypothetical protein